MVASNPVVSAQPTTFVRSNRVLLAHFLMACMAFLHMVKASSNAYVDRYARARAWSMVQTTESKDERDSTDLAKAETMGSACFQSWLKK
jgi:hypothetical protein